MGLFKQVKEMKGMIQDAPEQVRMANAIGAQAQQLAAAQQAAAHAQSAAVLAAAPAGDPADHEPIAQVSIELYVDISKGLATVGYDQSKGPEIAAQHGVSADRWETAVAGWNDRIRTSPDVASRFNALYIGRA
jgi:cytochrome c1